MSPTPSDSPLRVDAERRSRLFVDREVQSALVRRIVVHWFLFMFVIFGLVGLLQACIEHPGETFGETISYVLSRNALAIAAGISLIPIFVYDTIQATNRFAGPISRLRSVLRSMAQGQDRGEMTLRKEDFWKELATEFNQAIDGLRGRSVPKGS